MAGSKKSIYLAASTLATLAAGGDSLSGRINSVISGYAAIVEHDCPILAEREWLLVCDSLKGIVHTIDFGPGPVLCRAISEASPSIRGKWCVDSVTLAERVGKMRYSEQVAIIETVCRFWQIMMWEIEKDYGTALKEAGAKVR